MNVYVCICVYVYACVCVFVCVCVCVFHRNGTIMFAIKVHGYAVLYDKRKKDLKKRDMVENVCEKIAQNLNFVESGNFIRGSTKEAVPSCPGLNFWKNTIPMVKSYCCKVNLNLHIYYNRTLTQTFSCEVAF